MKKIIILLFVFFLTSCSFQKEPEPIDFLSYVAEFDGINFDFEEYINRLESSSKDRVRLVIEKEHYRTYRLDFETKEGDPPSFIAISIFDDISLAKEEYINHLEVLSCSSPNRRPLIRVDNVVVFSVEAISPTYDLFDEIGIERPGLIKINGSSKMEKRNTRKNNSEIIRDLERKGYRVISSDLDNDNELDICINSYTFLSDDNRKLYDVIYVTGEKENESRNN